MWDVFNRDTAGLPLQLIHPSAKDSKSSKDSKEEERGIKKGVITNENHKGEISEEKLVKQILYTLQGIDSDAIKFDSKTDAFIVIPTAGVSLSNRHLISKLAEAGWLVKRIQLFLTEALSQHDLSTAKLPSTATLHAGLVTQVHFSFK